MLKNLAELLRSWGFSDGAIDQIIGGIPAGLIVAFLAFAGAGLFWLVKWGGWAMFKGLAKRIFGLKDPEEIPSKDETDEHKKPLPPPSLPHSPASGFVNRSEHENGDELLPKIIAALAPGQNHLVSLWGAGGNGKTTLAIEAARALTDIYKNRIVWISADGNIDFSFDNFLSGIASSLERHDLISLVTESKSAALKSILKEEPALVILDNFETIAPDEQKKCADFLINNIPKPAMITTRQSLDSDQALNIHVQRMTDPEGLEYLEKLIKNSGNQAAFAGLERAAILTAANNNPLVLGWLVKQLVFDLDPEKTLHELSQAGGDAGKRIFDRSFDLPQLGEDGRAAILALTLFSPDASPAALCNVAGFEVNLERLKEALTKAITLSLVKATDSNARFYLEGLTRELAHQKFKASDSKEDFEMRFISYFLKYSHRGLLDTINFHNSLEPEKDNLLRAIGLAAETGQPSESAELYYNIRYFLSLRGFYSDSTRFGLLAFEAVEATGNRLAAANCLSGLGGAAHMQDRYREAEGYYREAQKIYKETGSQLGEANCQKGLGDAAQLQGRYQEAEGYYKDAQKIYEKIDHRLGAANCRSGLGDTAQMQGRYPEAERYYKDAQKTYEEIGDRLGAANCLLELGKAAQRQGRYQEAEGYYKDALKIYEEIGDRLGAANCQKRLGETAQKQGRYQEAEEYYKDALKIYEEIGHRLGAANCSLDLGFLAVDRREFVDAEKLLSDSLNELRIIGVRSDTAECLEGFGKLRLAQGRTIEAADHLNEALEISLDVSDRYRSASINHTYGLLEEKNKNKNEAIKRFERSIAEFTEIGVNIKADVVRADLERVKRNVYRRESAK